MVIEFDWVLCLPLPSSERGQFEFSRLRLCGIIENMLKLLLQLRRQEMTTTVIQPHLKKASSVIHNQVLPVPQVLNTV